MPAEISFGLRIPPCRPATEVAACVRAAEEAGFSVAWLPDSQFLWRDVWATLALAATVTESIGLGPCVTNFETRHPSVTAAAVSTVAELAPSRTLLGVGTGDSSIKTLGLSPTRLARMRAEIEGVRRLLAGAELSYDGRSMRLKSTPAGPVPIYMAATGPKALRLAGEVADGAITVLGLEPGLVRQTIARIGRRAPTLDVCHGTFCHVTEDEREAVRIVKPYVVATAQTGGREVLHRLGIDIDPPPALGGIYPDMSHAEDWDEAAEAAEEWVTDDAARRYADALCLVGSAEHCAKRLAGAVEAGAWSFYIRHFGSYTLPHEVLQAFGESIIPRLR